MRWLDRARFFGRALLGRRLETELDDELEFHLQEATDAYVARGVDPRAARQQAERDLGVPVLIKEDLRDARGRLLIETIGQDLRHGIRLLRRNPGFAAAAILPVALGIGTATAIFSVVYGVLLRPLPYPEPHRLAALWSTAPRMDLPRAYVGAANYRDWRAEQRSFENLALVRHIANFNLTGAGEPERLQGARVTASLFNVLRVAPALGRPFREDEETVGREFVVILSDRLWARRFNRDPAIVSRSISLNGQPHLVVGVMPEGFAFPGREFELWTPLTVNPDDYRTRLGYNFLAFGRLRPGVGVTEAQAELDGIARRLAERFPETNDGIGVLVAPMLADLTRTVRAPLQVLLGGVLLLLLVGCASLANLLVSRSVARSGELVLRSTLGAGRGRLVRQAVTELVPLVAVGGVAGLLIAALLLYALVPWLPASLPRVETIAINVPVVLCALVALATTMVAAGVWPALQMGRWDLASALRESLRGSATTLRGTRLRDGLVVAQVALAVVLSVASVLLARSFINLLRIDPGFRTEGIATLHLAIPRSSYPLDREVAAFCQAVLDRVTRVAGVTNAGMVNRLPLAGGAQVGMLELDRSVLPANRLESVDWRTVTPDYFRTLGIPLKAGRFFTDADREDAPIVGLVDERLARAAWPNENPIGRRFRIPPIAGYDQALFSWVTVVGVVGHIQHDGLAVDQRPQVYWNYLQRAQDRMALVVRTSGDSEMALPALVTAVRDVDPDQPVYDMRTMTDVVSRSVAQPWLTMVVLAAFAIAALVMAAVGVYGVIAYAVRQREIEFGVRMALGATAADVLLLVCRRGGALVGLGLAIGAAGAVLASRLVADLVYGVSRTDAASFLIAIAVLAATALLAVVLPASRVARCRPASVLRA